MAQFTLVWDNTDILANPNAINQQAMYRGKVIGGAFITAGFTPANPMATSVVSALSPVLTDNVIYQFKTQSLCTVGGPRDNDNGLIEIIAFGCIVPTITKTYNQATASINLTGLDITKVKFTLKRASDNVVVFTQTVNKASNAAATLATGLLGATNYYWEIELYTIVNSVELISSDAEFLGEACGAYALTTDANPVCDPITATTITSTNL